MYKNIQEINNGQGVVIVSFNPPPPSGFSHYIFKYPSSGDQIFSPILIKFVTYIVVCNILDKFNSKENILIFVVILSRQIFLF